MVAFLGNLDVLESIFARLRHDCRRRFAESNMPAGIANARSRSRPCDLQGHPGKRHVPGHEPELSRVVRESVKRSCTFT